MLSCYLSFNYQKICYVRTQKLKGKDSKEKSTLPLWELKKETINMKQQNVSNQRLRGGKHKETAKEHCIGYDTGTIKDSTADRAQRKTQLSKPLRGVMQLAPVIFPVVLTLTFSYLSHNVHVTSAKCWQDI